MSDLSFDHISNDLDNLQIDSIKMDTSLAMNYLKTKQEFHSTECCRQGKEEKVILDSCNNKIYCINKKVDFHIEEKPTHLLRKMTTLTEKLKSNTDLFAQLDYMIRQKPIDEGRIHMDLVIKQLLYWSLNMEESDCATNMAFIINVDDSAQLLRLGISGTAFVHHGNIYINATKQLAVICHLFTSLCHEVGLNNVCLMLKEHDDYPLNTLHSFDESTGSAGIVTERSDLDSALDVFLASTSTSPWTLKRIYVQESVYDEFKAKMHWKFNRDSKHRSDLYESDTKLFALDNFNTGLVTNKHVVNVEAYRTTKEVLSLMSNWRPDYVSLWASDVAEANEIAHTANCAVVWVNDFANFDGRNEISNAVYQRGFTAYHSFGISKTLSDRSKNWERSTIEGRKEILLECLRSYESTNEIDEEFNEFLCVFRSALRMYERGFFDVSNGVICMGIRKSVGGLRAGNINVCGHFAKSLASLAYGNTILIYYSSRYYKYTGLIESMVRSGVPIIVDRDDEMPKTDEFLFKSHYPGNYTNIKVIFMPYGTIFAN